MVIQKILFPEVGKCTEEELYFRFYEQVGDAWWEKTIDNVDARYNSPKAKYDSLKQQIQMKKGGKVFFDTYFNGCSIEKWMKYTILKEISLEIQIKGHFKVTLFSREKIHDDIITKVIAEQEIKADEVTKVVVPYAFGDKKGMYTFALEALEDDGVFYGGAYTSDIPEENKRDVKIGICICTFKREAFIEKNVRLLNQSILENKDSVLKDHLEIMIADNGQSLDREKLSSDKIHINPNRNLGGAGGFTRDLIELMLHREYGVTHALLIDDDIVIEPEAVVKTYTILTLLKDEYEDAFVGGAMLRLDKQTIQEEAGASWNGGYLNSLKHGLDLSSVEDCLYNEVEEYREFNAWWYCCFPMKVVTSDNLPLPIFIRGDDVEYGLRNMKHLILMNGICVWHEPFENKYSSFLEYYIMRNQLIDNSFHCQWYGAKQVNRTIFGHCMREIMFYRYKNVDLYLQGIKDFLKGPEWLMQQDGEKLHKDVMAAGYKGVELEKLDMPFHYSQYEESTINTDTKRKKFARMFTFNGLFLRANRENIVPMSAARPVLFYRAKRVMQYDVTSKKAFITEKRFGQSIKYIFKTLGMMCVVPFKIKKAQQAYRTAGLKLRTLEFWKEFLALN